ncbi:Protein of unknown function [Pseudomonas cuatrocienegasensis]|uniref:DUF2491 domain-containing protein n=1 Tax=Pseudomonas cuatrocienegasensis TaxID=543360 RepID=A0ABY1BRJ2_9PSED|nr:MULTISPECIES: DUF2491 family protein [Pseudomonas]OEC32610.1 hypothetical protein A7D25_23180 [Pseudomonas sp. 21C1]SER46437.1 Protein of unknown function [Pseudomonas cuatrocienegasensis]
MEFFKRLFSRSGSQGIQVPPIPDGPLGLGKGVIVNIDPGLKLLLDGTSTVSIPVVQQAFAQGVIDLGQSNWLTRLYLDDQDYWLQVHSTGSRDGQVEALVLFNYQDSQAVHSNAELARIAGPQSKIGLPTVEHEGKTYQREWGESDGQTDLVEFVERVSNPNESYEVKHLAMLYTRDIGLTGRKELLLYSVEEDLEGAVSVSTSLGVTLFTTDLQTI